MQGFSRNYNTIHGLLLKLNQLINVGNPQTRDITTIQGALNRLQDEIKRLGSYDFSTLVNLNTMIDNITVKVKNIGPIPVIKNAFLVCNTVDKRVDSEIKNRKVKKNGSRLAAITI